MVNKIAVMAVVLIVAVPILLGYGLAFEEVEKTTWNESNTRSITSVLYNDVKYSDLALNSYSLNIEPFTSEEYYPQYMRVGSSPVTSYPLGQSSIPANVTFDPLTYGRTGAIFFNGDYPVNATITGAYNSGGATVTETISIANMQFWRSIQTDTLTVVGLKADQGIYLYADVTSVTFDKPVTIQYETSSGSYADITYGWKFNQMSQGISIGSFTKAVITMDFSDILNTIPLGNEYTFSLQPRVGSEANQHSYPFTITIHRGSSAGGSYLYAQGHDPDGNVKTATIPLDDSDFTKNVYQLLMNRAGYELRYVGSWPSTMALVQSLATWSFSMKYDVEPPSTFDNIRFDDDAYLYETPIFRLDTAIREGFGSPVITDKAYDPMVLMPSVTGSYSISLSDIGYIGTSIGWGGETFEVKDGALIVDHKRIALSKLTLESKYLDGTRTNYINGKEISTGANTLQLNGTWGAIVSLTELTPETSTSNEWQPGEFAWNGVDSSFALMGLIASVGVFVGLGMYGKRSGAKVGMLMLICGGAVLIFLALI